MFLWSVDIRLGPVMCFGEWNACTDLSEALIVMNHYPFLLDKRGNSVHRSHSINLGPNVNIREAESPDKSQ